MAATWKRLLDGVVARPSVVFGLLALAILGPLLAPGYILTLDSPMVFDPAPVSRFFGVSEGPTATVAAVPADLLAGVFGEALPWWLVEKPFLVLVFLLAGVGAYRLCPTGRTGAYFAGRTGAYFAGRTGAYFAGRTGAYFAGRTGAYFAGLVYTLNPFTYTRFLAGQWGLLWAYALIPFAVKAFISLLETPGRRAAVRVAVLSTLVGLLQLHGFLLLGLVFGLLLLARLAKDRFRPLPAVRLGGTMGLGLLVFAGLNLYWLLPLLTAEGTLLGRIGQADIGLFAPRASSGFGVLFDTASMYGFWRDGYLHVRDMLPLWWLLPVIIIFMAAYGFVGRALDRRIGWLTLCFGGLAALSALLAIGASSDLARPLFDWSWEHVPLFGAFRDSNKFVALLCLAYAFLGGLGVSELGNWRLSALSRPGKVAASMALGMALVVPLLYALPMFGFSGQMATTDYPEDWYETREYLEQDKDDFAVLFLPWHQYQDYGWVANRDQRLASPARRFFGGAAIAGDNMEAGGIRSQSGSRLSAYVEFLLANASGVDNLGELLAPLGVRYVILVHESDFASYGFLYRQDDLRVAIERPGITLFRNDYPAAGVYAVDGTVYVESLDEYLELSRTRDVMRHVYLFGSAPEDGLTGAAETVGFSELHPAAYQVAGTPLNRLVFALARTAQQSWEYDGQPPEGLNLGMMPVFTPDWDGGRVVFSRFYRVHLPGYVVSVVTVVVLAGVLVWRRRRSGGAGERGS